jgi:hypothetical protein
MTVRKLKGSAIQTGTITSTQLSGALNSSISAGGGPKISNIIYPGDDTAANTAGGQTVYIVGSGFAANAIVYINGNSAPSVSFISSSNLQITTPALSAASYPLYVINPEDGGTAIKIPGLVISGEPTWVTSATLSEQGADDAWSISLSATSDSNVSYALADGSSLPAGISLAANGLISGTLSSPPNDDTTYNFTVVATDAENQDASRAFSVNVTVGEGVAFANTVLLLHADGTNNQNNHTFLDSSDNNFTITRNGNAIQGSFSPFSQTGWSGYFENSVNAQSTSGKYLTVANTSAFNIGTGDFTLEGWINPIQLPASDSFPTNWWQHSVLFGRGTPNLGDGYNLILGATKLIFQNNDGQVTNGTHNITINKWYHVAACRSGGTLRLFVNGSVVATTSSSFTGGGGSNFYIGSETGQGGYFHGYMSNVRLLVGTALYTGTFTPSTTPLTAVSNTVVLSLQSNRYLDNSTNNYNVTPVNNPIIIPYSPFAPTSKYTTAAVGGSGYFDGNDSLSLSSGATALNFGSGEFTVETWINPTISFGASQYMIFGNTSVGGATFRITDSSLIIDRYNQAQDLNGSHTNQQNTWAHIAFTRDGNTLRVYKNGVQLTSASTSSSYNFSSPSIATGAGLNTYAGYFSGMRFVKGQCLYPSGSTFAVPTSPPTNVANTQFLCNFTNAGIFDQTAKNILETVGDAKVSTAQYKYGTGSMVFDGTGDYLVTSSSVNNRLGSGDFTIEMWLYPSNTSSAYRAIIASDAYSATTNGWTVYQNGTSIEMYYSSGGSTPNIFTATSALTSSVWQHFALVRSSGTLKAYVNGTQVASVSNSINFVGDKIFIGDNNAGDYFFNGYIDDLRISRFARYTSNFTPPTSAFKDR